MSWPDLGVRPSSLFTTTTARGKDQNFSSVSSSTRSSIWIPGVGEHNSREPSSMLVTIFKVKIGDYETKKESGKTDGHKMEL